MTDKIFAHYACWATYRPEFGKVSVEHINPFLCTHITYLNAGLTYEGEVTLLEPDLLQYFLGLKKRNPSLKFMLNLGGWNEDYMKVGFVMLKPKLQNAFVESVMKFLTKYGFDGFELDWQYPALRSGNSNEKDSLIEVLKLFRPRFDKLGLILAATVGVSEKHISNCYDVPNLNRYLDYINLMTWDMRGPWDNVTGSNSPMYASSLESPGLSTLNVDAVVSNWISKGAEPKKLILGIGLYGRSFRLVNATNMRLGAPASAGTAGIYTGEDGTLSFLEILMKQRKGGWTTVWDDDQKVPYTYKDQEWIGYDNQASVKIKAEYAKSKGLGGVLVGSIDRDDVNNYCGEGKYPLMRAIKEVLLPHTKSDEDSLI